MTVTLLEHYFSNNPQIKSEIRTIDFQIGGTNLSFFSDNGVFSKSKIDYGSNILVTTILKSDNSNVNSILDLGCGYGFMGISLAKILNVSCDLVDVNNRAVHLCEKNIKLNKVNANAFVSDVYSNVKDKYDLIVTNPPIRAGKEVVLNFLLNAKDHLTSEGSLWFVIRKDQGAKSILKTLENDYFCQVLEKSKGFFAINAKKR